MTSKKGILIPFYVRCLNFYFKKNTNISGCCLHFEVAVPELLGTDASLLTLKSFTSHKKKGRLGKSGRYI